MCFLGFDFHVIKTKPKSSHTIEVFFISMNVMGLPSSQVSSLPHSLIVWFWGASKIMDV